MSLNATTKKYVKNAGTVISYEFINKHKKKKYFKKFK